MNADDKIRAILRTEADAVDPSPAGWDAITSGIAARRRRTWWLRSGAFATVAATVVAVAVFAATDHSRRGLDQTHTSPSASTSVTPPATASPSPEPVADDTPIGAIWPLTTTAEVRAWQADHMLYAPLSTQYGAALGFAQTYLGIPDASLVATGRLRFDVTRPVNGQPHVVTTVVLGGFGTDGGAPYAVTLATSNAVAVQRPAAGSAVTSPLAVQGDYRTADPSFTVILRTDTGAAASVELARAHATTGPPNVLDATLTFTTSARTGSILVTNPSLADGGLADAAAVPVTFGRAAGALPAAFVASRDGRLMVVSAATGKVVRYLTQWEPGGGAGQAELAADGKTVFYEQGGGTCSSYIQRVPAAGGTPTMLVPSRVDTVVGPVSSLGGTIAYLRSHCQGRTTTFEIVVGDQVTPVDGDVRSGPVLGARGVAYVTVKGTATTLHAGSATVAPPAGCEWLAVTWGADDTAVVAAGCGTDTRLYRIDANGKNLTLIGHLGSLAVRSLDYSAGYEHLLIGTLVINTPNADFGAYTYEGGVPRRIPGQFDSPTWS